MSITILTTQYCSEVLICGKQLSRCEILEMLHFLVVIQVTGKGEDVMEMKVTVTESGGTKKLQFWEAPG